MSLTHGIPDEVSHVGLSVGPPHKIDQAFSHFLGEFCFHPIVVFIGNAGRIRVHWCSIVGEDGLQFISGGVIEYRTGLGVDGELHDPEVDTVASGLGDDGFAHVEGGVDNGVGVASHDEVDAANAVCQSLVRIEAEMREDDDERDSLLPDLFHQWDNDLRRVRKEQARDVVRFGTVRGIGEL